MTKEEKVYVRFMELYERYKHDGFLPWAAEEVLDELHDAAELNSGDD